MNNQLRSNKETFVAASKKVKYYEPFERLYLRKAIQDLLKVQNNSRIDLFAIFDAVAKRGGFTIVNNQNRWQEIALSLPYYRYDFKSKYKEFLQPKQNQIYIYLKKLKKQYKYQAQPFVQFHLLSMTNPYGYYHIEDQSFSKHNYPNIDLYLNVRTICIYKPKLEKIIVQYAQKFYIMRKNMLMYGQARPFHEKQLEVLQLVQKNDKIKVALVGWSISTLITALKLKQFKIDHVIYPNFEDVTQMNETSLIAQEGIFMLDDSPFSYQKRLRQYGVIIQQVSENCTLLDQTGKLIPQKKVKQAQQIFCSLLSQLKQDEMSKRNLYTQMQYLVQKRKILIQSKLLKWHFQRYFMLNQLRGDYTTISDLHHYLTKRKFRVFLKRKKAYYIKDCSKLLQRVKSQVKFNTQPLKAIQHRDYQWILNNIIQEKPFTHLIFSQPQPIAKAILNSNYKISYMEDNFSILYQLNFSKYVCCIYKFTQKVKTKTQITEKTIQTQYNSGHVFFYIVNDGYQVMAVSKIISFGMAKSTFYVQLLAILQNRILQKIPQMAQKQKQICSFSYSFPVKEQTAKDRVTKLKGKQKMYLLLSYGTNQTLSRLSSQIDASNYIVGMIMGSTNDLYSYDSTSLDLFDHSYGKRIQQLIQKSATTNIAMKKTSQKNNEVPKIAKKLKLQVKQQQPKIQKQALILPIETTYKFLPDLDEFYANLNNSNQMINQNIMKLQSQADPFGFSNPVVLNYIKYLKKNCQFQKSIKSKIQKNMEILKYLQWNNLQEPIVLSRGLMLHSFGQARFGEPNIKQTLANKQQISHKQVKLCLFDGYLARRQYYCLQKSYKTTVYMQCIIYIQNIPYFIFFDQYFPTTIYYHTNPIILISQFQERIQHIKSLCLSNQGKLNRVKMRPHVSNNIYLSQVKTLILNQISQNKGKSLDSILKDKFSGSFKSLRLKSPQTIEDQCMLILKKAQDFLNVQVKNYFLKPLALFDLFFGYLNEQYLICQIMSQNRVDLQKIQLLDPQLNQQIQKIYTNQKKIDDFQLIIHHQTERLIVYRQFMAGKNDQDSESIRILTLKFQQNIPSIIDSSSTQNFRCYLMKGINSQRIELKNADQAMRQIIVTLLSTWTSLQIYQQLERLIRKQLLNEFILTPKLKVYFQMTRRQNDLSSQIDTNRIIQKNKDLQQEDRITVCQNIQSQKLMFVNGEYVYLGY